MDLLLGLKKPVLFIFFGIFFTASTIAFADDDIEVSIPVPSYKTDHLLESGLEGFLGECLNYCVTGICVRLIINIWPPSVKVILTPQVTHNVPDFVVNSYDEPGEEAWEEWREVVSEATQEAQSVIMELVTSFQVDGGQINSPEHKRTGDEADERFKEIDIIGHPMTYFNNALAGKHSTQLTREQLEALCGFLGMRRGQSCEDALSDIGLDFDFGFSNGTDDGSVGSAFEDFGSGSFEGDWFDNKQVTEGLGMEDAFNTMDQMTQGMEVVEKVQEVGNLVGGGMGVEVAIDHYFCKTDITGFMPYYLTQLDSFWWREPIPLGTDLDYAFRYARCSIIAIDGSCIVGQDELGLWGTIYPRHGTVIQNNNYKSGAVMATRAIDVLLDPDSDLRIRMPAEAMGRNGIWQRIWPEVDTCQDSLKAQRNGWATIYLEDRDLTNIKSDDDSYDFANHSWAYWRPYQCCLSDRGSHVTTISIPNICLND